jgi:hypothetical protein
MARVQMSSDGLMAETVHSTIYNGYCAGSKYAIACLIVVETRRLVAN